jgi:hypothetical protein
MTEVTSITVKVGPNGAVKRFSGRFAWALAELIRAGARGVTPIDQPAPRWSHYIYRLRRKGVPITTVPEMHGGSFAGRHGRYIIGASVVVVASDSRQGQAA